MEVPTLEKKEQFAVECQRARKETGGIATPAPDSTASSVWPPGLGCKWFLWNFRCPFWQ
jgi:hypothetical protein